MMNFIHCACIISKKKLLKTNKTDCKTDVQVSNMISTIVLRRNVCFRREREVESGCCLLMVDQLRWLAIRSIVAA